MASVNVHLHAGRGEPGPISGAALRDALSLASAHLLGAAALQAELERVLAAAASTESVFDDQFEGAVNVLVAAAQLIGRIAEEASAARDDGAEPHRVLAEAYASLTRPAGA
jgi:hypothetical protein